KYMRRKNMLSHAGQGRSDAGKRISAEGYDWISYGENVAAGYGSDEATIKGWLKSKGHCKNIMSPKFKEMGMASSGQFYTQVFASRR
ncbi:MAG TPA: CAP domain-containing protein, partial [Flavipsychrobacter sp.]